MLCAGSFGGSKTSALIEANPPTPYSPYPAQSAPRACLKSDTLHERCNFWVYGAATAYSYLSLPQMWLLERPITTSSSPSFCREGLAMAHKNPPDDLVRKHNE
jgi:hypothetical protein